MTGGCKRAMSCPLLDLPREIREEIYSYVLVIPRTRDAGPDVICLQLKGTTLGANCGPGTRLLYLNRRIHDEIETVFYSRFRFKFPISVSTALLDNFLYSLSPAARTYIRHAELYIVLGNCLGPSSRIMEAQWEAAFELLVDVYILPGLRSVDLVISFSSNVGKDEKQRQIDMASRIAMPLKMVETLTINPHWIANQEHGVMAREVMKRMKR